MKFEVAALFLLFATINAAEDPLKICSECFEDIDDARDCLRDCNNQVKYITDDKGEPILSESGALQVDPNWGSLLDFCLDDDSKDGADIEDIDDLVDCCGFADKDCDDTLQDVQDCLTTCIHPCLTQTAAAWMDCVQDETGKGNCARQDCLDGFLEDLDDEVDFGSGDVFSAKELEKRFKDIAYSDLEDCNMLEEFVVETCEVGKTCCKECNPFLATCLDCMLNTVVGPFVGAELNTTLPTCPIDEDCKMKEFEFPANRELSSQEAELFNKALTRQTNSRRANLVAKMDQRQLEDSATTQENVEMCSAKMNSDILAYNITFATNKYLECITASVLASLEDADAESTGSGSATASAVAYKMIAMVAVMILAFF